MGHYICKAGARGRQTGTRYTTPCENTDHVGGELVGFRPHKNEVRGTGRPGCFAARHEGGCYCSEPMPLDSTGTLESEETDRGDK